MKVRNNAGYIIVDWTALTNKPLLANPTATASAHELSLGLFLKKLDFQTILAAYLDFADWNWYNCSLDFKHCNIDNLYAIVFFMNLVT